MGQPQNSAAGAADENPAATMGATNKCLARITKSPHGSNTTNQDQRNPHCNQSGRDEGGDIAGEDNRLAGKGGAKGPFTTLIASTTQRAGRTGNRPACHEKLSYRGSACARIAAPRRAVYSSPVTNHARMLAAAMTATVTASPGGSRE